MSPFDSETILRSVAKTGRLLIVDEAFSPCGLGAEIAARIADAGFDDLDAPIRRLNGVHTPTPYSPPLEAAAQAVGVSEAARAALPAKVREEGFNMIRQGVAHLEGQAELWKKR